MSNYSWRIITAILPWNPVETDPIIECELCAEPASCSSKLIDTDAAVRETHVHCSLHRNHIVTELEAIRLQGLKWVTHERHWMHMWKVGYRPCAHCRADSRIVGSLLDENNEIVDQAVFCEAHSPTPMEEGHSTGTIDDVVADITFGLGAAFTVTFDQDMSPIAKRVVAQLVDNHETD